MSDHPLEGLMKTTMESIRNMVDVNTILGDPVETPDGTVVIPISKVAFGFAAGGSEYEPEPQSAKAQEKLKSQDQTKSNGQSNGDAVAHSLPFGGGTGAGISLQPVAFLVVGPGGIRLLPVDHGGALWNRLIDLAPGVINQIKAAMGPKSDNTVGSGSGAGERLVEPTIVMP